MTAIALALPLGICDLAVAASQAEAFIQAIKHHLETCMSGVILQRAESIRTRVFTNPTWSALFSSRAFPHGSKGIDERAWEHLNWLRRQLGNILYGNAESVWRELVNKSDDWDFYVGLVFVWERQQEMGRRAREEAKRNRLEALRIRTENEIRAFDRFRNECANGQRTFNFNPAPGRTLPGTGGCLAGSIGGGARTYTGENGTTTEYTGYDLENPDEYATDLQISVVEPLGSLAEIAAIEDYRQATSDNRSTIVTIVEEFNTLEDRVLANSDRTSTNGSLIDAIWFQLGLGRLIPHDTFNRQYCANSKTIGIR